MPNHYIRRNSSPRSGRRVAAILDWEDSHEVVRPDYSPYNRNYRSHVRDFELRPVEADVINEFAPIHGYDDLAFFGDFVEPQFVTRSFNVDGGVDEVHSAFNPSTMEVFQFDDRHHMIDYFNHYYPGATVINRIDHPRGFGVGHVVDTYLDPEFGLDMQEPL